MKAVMCVCVCRYLINNPHLIDRVSDLLIFLVLNNSNALLPSTTNYFNRAKTADLFRETMQIYC